MLSDSPGSATAQSGGSTTPSSLLLHDCWQTRLTTNVATTYVFSHQTRRSRLLVSSHYCTGWAKEVNPKCSTHNFVKYWPIKKFFFTVIISRKFAMQRSLNIPPQLKRVATLPCEMFMSENSLLISETTHRDLKNDSRPTLCQRH